MSNAKTIILVTAFVAACGTSSEPAPAPDAALGPDASVTSVAPQLGLWRARVRGPSTFCSLGGVANAALPDQSIANVTASAADQFTVADLGAAPLRCTLSGRDFVCPIAPESAFGADGLLYTQKIELSYSFPVANAGTAAVTSTVSCLSTGCPPSPCIDTAMYDVTPFAPAVDLAAGACADEPNLTSTDSRSETFVNFTNRTSGPLSRYWLDYTGTRVAYPDVGPGETVTQRTFVGHPWVVVDANGTCLGIFHPASDYGRITVP